MSVVSYLTLMITYTALNFVPRDMRAVSYGVRVRDCGSRWDP